MSLRTIITCLLAVVLTATTAAQPFVAPQDEAATAANDWQEARELAASFVKRFHETGDIEPLTAEFFVKDFAERAAAEEDEDATPLMLTRFLDGEVLRRASPEELRRFYIAELNLSCAVVTYMTFRYSEREAAGTSDEVDEDDLIAELPREVTELFKTDGAQVGIAAGERQEKCSHAKAGDAADCHGNPVSEEDCTAPVKTVAQMREVASAMEKATAALRALTPPTKKVFEDEAERGSDEEAGRFHIYEPNVWMTGKDYLGCPEGTRLISVEAQALLALQFRFQLTRTDGKLKVLSMAAVLDGD